MTRTRRFLVATLDDAGNWPPEIARIRGLVRVRTFTAGLDVNAGLATAIAVLEGMRSASSR